MSTNSWSIDADGDWSVAADWSLKHAPGASDDVVINTADSQTVTYSAGAATVNSLTVGNDGFTVSGGSLTASAASFAHLLTITSGALGFGAANVSVGSLTQSGGTLSGTGAVTVSGATAFAYVYPSGAIETGTGKTILQGTTSLKSYELGLDGGRILENQGTLTWSQGEDRAGLQRPSPPLGGARRSRTTPARPSTSSRPRSSPTSTARPAFPTPAWSSKRSRNPRPTSRRRSSTPARS